MEGEEAVGIKRICERMMERMTEALEKPCGHDGKELKRLEALENKIHSILKQVAEPNSIKYRKPKARSSQNTVYNPRPCKLKSWHHLRNSNR